MLVSFIISTHNRCEVVLKTLDRIAALGLADSSYEVHVIDNASRDGTADAVAMRIFSPGTNAETFADIYDEPSATSGRHVPALRLAQIHLYRQTTNSGSCAKNIALPHARGKFIVFLDDDSYPERGSIERMIHHFEQRPRLGAATFTITLLDGSRECSAFPNVFIGCGVGLRREAIEEVGGLPDDFFMQAEEYDLSLRLLDAGWEVIAFDDLHVTHLKTPMARSSARAMRLDVRNNLVLISRYFPDRWAIPFCRDWLRRYWMIARANGQRRAFLIGMLQGSIRALRCNRRPVSENTFERFARIQEIKDQMMIARRQFHARTVLFIDLGKNILPYWLAAQACGLRIAAIADSRLAPRTYRGIPIVTDDDARQMAFDIAIVSNSSPVHARTRAAAWRSIDSRPIVDLLARMPDQVAGAAA